MITMLFFFLFLCKFLNFCIFFFLSSSFFFSPPFLFFLFSLFFLPLLFFFISQRDDFLNFPCYFLGAVLPAPALYPSLTWSYLTNAISTIFSQNTPHKMSRSSWSLRRTTRCSKLIALDSLQCAQQYITNFTICIPDLRWWAYAPFGHVR